jgi:c-di-GMP-binding flagellar brake protein YcgR
MFVIANEDFINTRNDKRYNIKLALKLITKDGGHLGQSMYSISNLSLGGMFVDFKGDCHVQKSLGYKIYLGEKSVDFIEGEGNIVWVRINKQELNPGFGFKFTNMEKKHKEALSRYLKNLDY